jgi:WD40 repeat protein
MVSMQDGVPVPKVIDFGIAKATQGELTDKTIHTQFQQFIGTPAYMSPEQAEMSGLDIDTRSDIYSLGVLLYELLVGSTPFNAKELMASGLDAIRRTIREKEPVRPSSRLATLLGDDLTTTVQRRSTDTSKLLHQLKGDLDWIVMKCLEKDRTRRYDTANGLAADLKRHLKNEPVVARPPSTAYRLQKAWRRNKLAFGAGTAVVAALVVGLTVAATGWRQTRVERDKAQANERQAITAGQRAHAGEQEAQRAAAILRRTAYVGDMALVQQAIGEGNLGRAKSLLARYLPKAQEDDLRGFEWRYLWAQAGSDEVARLGEYRGWVGGLAVSPDGIYLASEASGSIEIRSLQNHALILALTNAGGRPLQFSPDSQFLVTVRDKGLALLNTRTWKQESEVPGAKAPFAFAQNGKSIVAGQDDHLALWSTEKFGKIVDLPGRVSFDFASTAMAVSQDGNTVSFGDGPQIRSWDVRTHIELAPMSYPLGGWSTSLAISPEGLLAAAHWNGHVTLWDSKTRQLLHTLDDHLAWVSKVLFSPDGSQLASASADQNIFVYETRSGKRVRSFKGHEGEIWALQYSPDGHWLVSGSERDKSVRLWDVTGSSRIGSPVETTIPLRFVDSNRSLSLVCVSLKEGFVRMDLKTGTIQSLAGKPMLSELPGWGYGTRGRLSVSPVGSRAATLLPEDRGLQIWSLLSGEREIVLTNTFGPISYVLFSEDGKRLATAGQGSLTRVWNTTDWSSETVGESSTNGLHSLAFSRNGLRLAQANEQGGMVFDLASGKAIFPFNADQITCLAMSQDGRFLAAGTGFALIHLWDVDSRQKRILRGHVAGLFGLSFSPDGKTLASCGDSRLKLWNTDTVQEILTLARFSSVGLATMFSADGSALSASQVDGHGQLWRAPSFEQIAAAEAKEKAETQQP